MYRGGPNQKRKVGQFRVAKSSADLHVHHIDPRSRLGDDALENLITLCACCHRDVHLPFRWTAL
ncbi:MAG: HNH endonuclease [Candidatus Acidiferrales bacterium]